MQSPFRALTSVWQSVRNSGKQKKRTTTPLSLESLERREVFATDVILEWNNVMLQAEANDLGRAAPEQGGPVLAARAFGIVSAAMYDAYNSIHHIGDKFFTLVPATKGADSDAAVARAAADTLIALFPHQAVLFRTSLKHTLDRIPNGFAEQRGLEIGAAVAKRMMVDRATDGFDMIGGHYTPNGEPGFHNVDPIHPGQGFYGAGAMAIKPFAMGNVDNFEARALDDGTVEGRAAFLKSDEYTRAYAEVKRFGSVDSKARTAEQTTIAQFWGYDGRPGLGTPPRLYNQIVRGIAVQKHNSEAQNARLFALVNISMADAGVAAWNTKYDDAFWRPILGIRNGAEDGNDATVGDANWSPLGAPCSNPRNGESNFTPPFPAYTSGHATFGAATFETLKNFYGTDKISFDVHSDEFNGKTKDADGSVRPVVVRHYTSFTQAKNENAMSRIFLGIHWRFDATEGIRQGNAVADYAFHHIMGINAHAAKTAQMKLAVNSAMLASLAGNEDTAETSSLGGATQPALTIIAQGVDDSSDDFTPDDTTDGEELL